MKIIYVANTRMPTEMAHGLQIMKTCESFVKNGVDLELVIPFRFGISPLGKKNPFEYYKVDKTFKIKKIPCFDLTPLNRFLGPISFLTQALSFSFFVFVYLLFHSVIRRDKGSGIIYSRDRFSLFSINKKNVVFEAHKVPKSLFLRGVKKIITISKGIKQDLVKRGVDSNKIFIAPDALDLADFDIKENKEECRKKLDLPLDSKLVVYTGHLYKWKGVETLAKSSKFLKGNTTIVIVGGIKWYLSNFKNFVKKNNLKNILILGYQDYSKIPYFLKAADCLVLTGTKKSKTSKEYTSPMKMFEYMASKRPIVASDLPAFREVLNDKNAVLVKPDSPEDLAEGVKKVLNNPELAKKVSSQAHKDAQQYTWDKRAKKILRFITS